VEAAAEKIEAELGEIDIWVNNAMTSVFSPIKKMTPEEFRRVIEVTYLGYVYGTLAALKRMLPRDRGVIVQVGSALAYRGIRCGPRTVWPSTPCRDFAIHFVAS
jgi:NAD(P)-dependent dehydrogenase (short-subunit alcohol dehydrogenase family)